MRRATENNDVAEMSTRISIHALREEGDDGWERNGLGWLTISIHALREEGDC